MTPARPGPTAVLGAWRCWLRGRRWPWPGFRPAAAPVEPGAPEPESRTVGADATTCPAFPLDPGTDGTATDVGVVAPEARRLRAPRAAAGRRRRRRRTGRLLTLDERGSWQHARLAPDETSDLLVESSGGLSVGAATHTAQLLPDAAGGGLAVQRCAAPARQWWFVGAGSSAERESTLLLSNVDESDAVVDVVLRGADGPLETTGAEDVRIAAGENVDLPLSGLVAGESDVAVEVVAAQGRVVAAVADDWSGVDVVGSDWLPASPAPAETVLLPGVLDPDPRSRLVVANASGSAAPVDVSLVDDNGTFVPTDAPRVVAPAGGVVSVRLPDVGDGAALLVQADTPVTAAVRVGTATDVGYAVQGPALDGPAVVPVDLGSSLDDAALRLHLAAVLDPDAGNGTESPPARTATVAAYDADGAELATHRRRGECGDRRGRRPGEGSRPQRFGARGTAYLVVTPDEPPVERVRCWAPPCWAARRAASHSCRSTRG